MPPNQDIVVRQKGQENKGVPKFDSYSPASVLSSRIKSKNRNKNTKAELLLRKHLWKIGLRYRLHIKDLPGKPDIVFRKAKVAVFCDGDFWHGRNWKKLKKQLGNRHNQEYWISKIQYNIVRDLKQTQRLQKMGWQVMRYWEGDIKKDPARIANEIYSCINKDA